MAIDRNFISLPPLVLSLSVTQAGKTALQVAIDRNKREVAKVLIAAGAVANAADNNGRTAVMKAARAGHTATVD